MTAAGGVPSDRRADDDGRQFPCDREALAGRRNILCLLAGVPIVLRDRAGGAGCGIIAVGLASRVVGLGSERWWLYRLFPWRFCGGFSCRRRPPSTDTSVLADERGKIHRLLARPNEARVMLSEGAGMPSAAASLALGRTDHRATQRRWRFMRNRWRVKRFHGELQLGWIVTRLGRGMSVFMWGLGSFFAF